MKNQTLNSQMKKSKTINTDSLLDEY